ncbi:MAG: hypothetical protein KC420_17230, partial [Myxococcales bacterium]|nr:hypothetical protein [Myxococcales bacterium]
GDAAAAAGPNASASAAAVPAAAPPATVDDLLALMPTGPDTSFVALRQPGLLLDYGAAAFGFYEGPLGAIAAHSASHGEASLGQLAELARVGRDYAEAKKRFDEVRAQLSGSAVDLRRGVAFIKNKESSLVVFGSTKPDSLRSLFAALGASEAETMICKAVADAPGYAVCGDSQAEIDAYRPGGAGPATKARLQAELPGVALDDAQIVASINDNEPLTMALTVSGGDLAFHVASPSAQGDLAEMRQVLSPGKPDLVRFVRPGTGFFWTKVDPAVVRSRNPDINSLPPMFSGLVNSLTGEVMIGGVSQPSALQVRIGVSDTAPFASTLALASMLKSQVPKSIPGITGSKLSFEQTKVGPKDAKVDALHLGASGLPMIESFREKLGFSLDLWLFAADGAISLVAGADEVATEGLVAAGSAGGLAGLPPSLARSLESGDTAAALHLPLDPLQGPVLRTILEEAKARGADVDPELARLVVGLGGPLSSVSLWVSEADDKITVHTSVQLIGDLSSDEGKAALEAAKAVAAGGDAKALFTDLLGRYPDSARATAYKARAGEGGAGDLVGSALGAIIGVATMASPVMSGTVDAIEVPVVPPVVPVAEPAKELVFLMV